MASEQIFRKKTRALIQRAINSNVGRKTLDSIFRALDIAGGLAIRTWVGAKFVGLIIPGSRPVLCTACFTDHGLQIDTERIGIKYALPCPTCGSQGTKKLTLYLIRVLASQFFVRGSVHRETYGSAPLVQFNEARFQKGDYEGPKWLQEDVVLISDKGQIGLFHYGPRLWMLGDIEPLEALQNSLTRDTIIEPRRVCRRLQLLRGWSYDKEHIGKIFT